MSVNPIDDTTTPKTTGSLEDLFRHHLGEEAAVPPRPMLWDQIDNSLLIRQNEIYRRRLTATRWVAAASLLLATLAGTGWWAGRSNLLGTGPETAVIRPAASGANDSASGSRFDPATYDAAATGRNAGAVSSGAREAAASAGYAATAPTERNGYAPASRLATAGAVAGRAAAATRNSAAQLAALSRPGASGRFAAAQGAASRTEASGSEASGAYAATSEGAFAARASQAGTTTAASGNTSAAASPAAASEAGTTAYTATYASAGTSLTAAATAATTATGTSAASGTAAASLPTLAAASAAELAPEALGQLATSPAALALGDATALPGGLATTVVPTEVPADVHRWKFGATYAVGAFNPNINFSRVGIEPEYDYNTTVDPNSPALTEVAATQYRQNLRMGLTQRIALLASRHLSNHWSVSTGAEFSQSAARSASSSAFLGEQVYDLGVPGAPAGPLRTTDFRYRMASVPVQLSYDNTAKRGWSLYGRLGGVVSALLGVRSEVEGSPEATRTFTITSASTPYRRVLGSLRAGAGTRFRPSTGSWAFTLGPTAELGLVSLNAHPVQSYLSQSHPYSFGLEAAVEFGK